ncbi:MAG: hypothetical protein IM541_03200 [Chitinophagaceae bacterium]|jgi:hypothetical protein|nr:hypothetical protein [Chitinophagaceae bacterium]
MRPLRLKIFYFFLFAAVLSSCEKEFSQENGGFSMTARGTLLDSSGNCKQIAVNGTYKVDVNLTSSNQLQAKVNFITTGKYIIESDTVNGIWFRDSGFVLQTGAKTVGVRGFGKPLLPKTSVFTLKFNGTFCNFPVTTTGSGGSGGGGTDYFPTTEASNWTYEFIPNIGNLDTFRITVAEDTLTIDSLTYYQFGSSLGDTLYFAKNSTIGNYYALGTPEFDYVYIFDSIPNFPLLYPFLKESAAVNENWETSEYGTVKLEVSPGVFEYGDTKAKFTIVSKNSAPYTVGGNTYQNVIAVKREIWFKPNQGIYRMILVGTSYYAKGFGLIDQVIGITPNVQNISITRQPVIY